MSVPEAKLLPAHQFQFELTWLDRIWDVVVMASISLNQIPGRELRVDEYQQELIAGSLAAAIARAANCTPPAANAQPQRSLCNGDMTDMNPCRRSAYPKIRRR
jgi:hypothetical protein